MNPFNRPWWRPRVADEVDEELSFHLEMRTRELIAAGIPQEDIVLAFHPARLRHLTGFAVG